MYRYDVTPGNCTRCRPSTSQSVPLDALVRDSNRLLHEMRVYFCVNTICLLIDSDVRERFCFTNHNRSSDYITSDRDLDEAKR